MKYTIILVCFILFITCVSSRRNKYEIIESPFFYKVYKIDSIHNYYLLYAKKEDSLYKIVSEKQIIKEGEKIQVGEKYPFKLHSRLSDFRIGNVTIPTKNTNVDCFAFDSLTYICLEGDSIRDLYYADNIKGIYFIKAK